METKGSLSRRALIRRGAWSGLAVAVAGLAACGQPAPASPPSATKAPDAAAAKPAATTAAAVSATAPAPAAAAAEVSFWPRNPTEQSVVWEKLLPILKQ